MYVTIRLRPEALMGAGDSSGQPSGLPADLAAEAEGLGIEILPMHPDVTDLQLGRYFYAEIDDPVLAADVAERIGRVASVDWAYIKPPEGPPEPP